MATLLTESASAQLDQLLADVCAALQITPSQYKNAEEKYIAVGRWLGAPGSTIEKLHPRIYPQGSLALGTTTRPWTDEDEYDLDLVLEVDPTSNDPMRLYRLVEQRLNEHAVYRDLLERRRRCLCLNYTEHGGIFHLDILPAREDTTRGGTCVEIPDRKTPTVWQPSNPLGYKAWFEKRASSSLLLERVQQAPLPGNLPAEAKPVLKRVVQLLKRRRDLAFIDRPDDAPRSILLTTLAATYYDGSQDVANALLTLLVRIEAAIREEYPERIVVCNPTNPDERFCESFTTETRYRAFVDFVSQFRIEVEALLSRNGIDEIHNALAALFGDMPARRAIREYTERMNSARANAQVYQAVSRAAPATLLVSGMGTQHPSPSSRTPIAPNTFYGE